MIRILFGLLILALFVAVWLFFLKCMSSSGKHWFWQAGSNHLVAITIAVIIALVVIFTLAQPLAFLKYIFG